MKKIRYKALDKDFKCRGFQYEVGKEYEIQGEVTPCKNGFHACENPLDVFNYYDMLESRFAQVEQGGNIKEDGDKTCSSRIEIKAELNLADIIRLGVEWIIDKTKFNGSSGYYAQIGSSGYSAQIGSSGDYAQIESTGKDSVICCAGSDSKVKAKKGSWITLSEWKNNRPICVKTEYVDGERIKEDTWYELKDGEFQICQEQK